MDHSDRGGSRSAPNAELTLFIFLKRGIPKLSASVALPLAFGPLILLAVWRWLSSLPTAGRGFKRDRS